MSGAKSILDIDLKDEKWQAFWEQFQKFNEAVKDLPGDWGKVGAGMADASNAAAELNENLQGVGDATAGVAPDFQSVINLLLVISDDLSQIVELMEKTGEETEEVAEQLEKAEKTGKRFFIGINNTNYSMANLARTTHSVATGIAEATVSLLRWTGIAGVLGGLLGGGGLWGIERLGSNAGAMRRGALGLGVQPGEQQAFGINYGRFVDPGNTLESVANAQTDLSKRWAFNAMGVSPEGDPAALAGQLVQQAKRLFDRNPTQQGADAYGLTQFFSMDELRRLHNTPASEVDEAAKNYADDRAKLGLDPNVLRGWQDFTQQMQRAGRTIENTFIVGLVPLERPLADLSKSFTDVVSAFLKAPEIKALMVQAADGLEQFSVYIGTKAFKDDVESFEAGFKRVVAGLGRVVAWLGGVITGAPAAPGAPAKRDFITNQDTDFHAWLKSGHDPDTIKSVSQRVFGVNEGDRAQFAKDYFRTQGDTEAGAAAITATLAADSKLDPDAYNPAGGGRGAVGLAGWRGSRIDDFQYMFGHPLYDWKRHKGAPFDEQLAFAQWELTHTEKASGDAARNAAFASQAARGLVHSYLRPGQDETSEANRADLLSNQFVRNLQPTAAPPLLPPGEALLARAKPAVDNVRPNNFGLLPPRQGDAGRDSHVTVKIAPQTAYAPPPRPAPAPQVKITVQNNTGGSAVVSASQAGAS